MFKPKYTIPPINLNNMSLIDDLRLVRYSIMEKVHKLWWRFAAGQTTIVIWPRNSDNSDPNYLYRPWLEEHVGIQHIDWDWKINEDPDYLDIVVRIGKTKYSAIIALMWS